MPEKHGGQGDAADPLGVRPVVSAARKLLICFRHLGNYLFTNLPHVFTLNPTPKIIMQYKLFIFLPHGAGNIILHNIRDKELRQSARINNFLSRLFNVLHEIGKRITNSFAVYDFIKIIPAEAFQKERILHSNLSFPCRKTETLYLFHFPVQRSLRNKKDSMKVQPLLFGRSLPDTDILPALPNSKVRKSIPKFLFEAVLGMYLSVIGERCKVILWTL